MDDSNRDAATTGQAHDHAVGGCGHDHGAQAHACGHAHSDAQGEAHGCGHAHAEGHACGHDHGHDHAHGHSCAHAANAYVAQAGGHACSGTCGDGPAEAQGPSPYELVGGDAGVRALVDRFYDVMDVEERFADLRAMHPATLDGSRDKLYWFLSGWMGGPDLFSQKVGAGMLRARHLPYPIGVHERDQWLTCMAIAMSDVGIKDPFYDRLLEGFCGTADWMRNQAG